MPMNNSKPAYQNIALSIEERVDDLVSRMTLEEKVSQMVYDAPAIERLQVPKYNWWNECLHGVAWAGVATVFPQAIGLGATWNPGLVHRVATAISDEARAKHHEAAARGVREIFTGLTFWSPNVNLFRDPRWGRGQETYGECPYLMARIGVAFVKGLQGDDARYLKLVSTPKHFAVHSGPELDRHRFDAVVDERDLRETYLPHFEACVREAGAYSVMGAYNRTNGEPCCASERLLQEILREEWEFEGYVVSDCWAIRNIWEDHELVETPAEAASLAVKNGCDLNCGETYPALIEAVEKGLIDEATIDVSVRRLFKARFFLGQFDPPDQVAYAWIPYDVVDSPDHRKLALQAARESIVLLKNAGGFLPLDRDMASIAVVGPNADSLEALLGNYHGTPAKAITPLQGIREKLALSTRVYAARGCEIAPGVPPLDVVPASCLRPLDGDGPQAGLTAAYHDGARIEGEPARVQVDPLVDFDWKHGTPLTGQRGDRFAVRWEGFLVPPVTGTYRVGAMGSYEYALYLEGGLIAEGRHRYGPITQGKDVELEGGRYYHVRLDYESRGPNPRMRLQWVVPGRDYLAEAVAAAQRADVVVAVVGITAGLEGEEMRDSEKRPIEFDGFAGGDRTRIDLPAPQREMLERLHELGKPIVVVLLSGSALAVNWAEKNAAAIVAAWYPGQAGDAVADVLFGDHNPGGRLPVTFYRSVDDLPPFEDYDMEGHTYRYFRGEPLYPFGYGLSYTTFAYDGMALTPDEVAPGEPLTVSVEVQNTGKRAGDEVVQLYVSDVEASVPVPIRSLAGFERVHLEPGEKRTVRFTLAPRQLSLIDDAGRRVIEPGEFLVTVGGGQPVGGTETLSATFEVTGEVTEL
jgi:beta-glucosidase